MAKRNHNRGRGARGGTGSTPPRGRGGGDPGGQGRGAPRTRGTPGSSFLREELDFTIRMYADSPNPAYASSSGRATPREGINYRGRGRGGGYVPRTPQVGDRGWNHSPRGSFNPPPNGMSRGRGRGRGRGEINQASPRRGRGLGAGIGTIPPITGPNSTLSDLLFKSRPLLRPIKFVPSVYSPFLFQEEEEILQATIEEVGDDEASHVPTADQVTRIFSGVSNTLKTPSSSPSEDEMELEEIDFHDTAKLLESTERDAGTAKRKLKVQPAPHTVEDQPNLPRPAADTDSIPIYDAPAPRTARAHLANTRPQEPDAEAGEGWPDKAPRPSGHRPTNRPTSATLPKNAANRFGLEAPLSNTEGKAGPGIYVPEPEPPAEDEEIIVYVAPHPKVRGHSAPTPGNKGDSLAGRDSETGPTIKFEPYVSPPTLSLALMSINELTVSEPPTVCPPRIPSTIPTAESLKFHEFSAKEVETLASGRKLPSVIPPRMAKVQKAWEQKKARRQRVRGKKRRSSGRFAALGALLSEAQLHGGVQGDALSGEDPRSEERRKGDSDLEWGTDSEGGGGSFAGEGRDESAVDASTTTSAKAKGKQKARPEEEMDDHGMEVDPELEMDVGAMKRFVGGLMGREAETFTSMDDVAIEERIRAEDEEGLDGAEGSSDDEDTESEDVDVENVLKLEERLLVGESEDDQLSEDEDEVDEDDSEEENDFSPRSSFQARLERLRAKTRGRRFVDAFTEDEDEDDILERNMTWTAEDDIGDRIEDLLFENADILDDRHGRNKVFRAVQNGDFAGVQPAKKGRNKYKDTPEDLQFLWERDRQKKAERKRVRELEKLIQAADPYSKKKGGKKGRKAMLAAARLDPTITIVPNRIIDMTTLVQQIRRFVANFSGPRSMSLPPADKATRKAVHELALVFGLKSQSKGHGNARYTTLSKTTRTGEVVDEKRIARIVRRGRGGEFVADKQWERVSKVPKHREGEEVGAAAPKIGESNIGFRMLASMGWAEGNQIGLSGGLDAPLVAIVKHSKLGLGALK